MFDRLIGFISKMIGACIYVCYALGLVREWSASVPLPEGVREPKKWITPSVLSYDERENRRLKALLYDLQTELLLYKQRPLSKREPSVIRLNGRGPRRITTFLTVYGMFKRRRPRRAVMGLPMEHVLRVVSNVPDANWFDAFETWNRHQTGAYFTPK